MKNTQDILQYIQNAPSNKVKFAITDIDGILRGKIITRSKFLKAIDHSIGFCNVVFGWDMNDACYDNTRVTGWHTGYPDAMATIDLNSFRKIPWSEDMSFFLGDFSQSPDIGPICPRTLLRNIRQQSLDLGFIPKFSKEFEWFNFSETPQTLKEKNYSKPTPLTPGMFGYSVLRSSQNDEYFNDLFDLLHQFEVPIEGIHTETGDGVYEACIEADDILEAADRAILFKTGVKEIASRYGIMASFMAKWNNDLPGCSGHIHQSLWDKSETKNLFYDESGTFTMSKLMKHYVAGQLYCLPYILPMYAPTVNSYKRYVAGSWSSTTVSWGIENRTTALRVVNHDEGSMRLETRVPGADANPYLSMAASLAAGLYGIKHKLSLPSEPTKGNEYESTASPKLPKTLKEATDAMRRSGIAKELFGEIFTDHFIRTREWEWDQFTKRVTDWELKRYFEII